MTLRTDGDKGSIGGHRAGPGGLIAAALSQGFTDEEARFAVQHRGRRARSAPVKERVPADAQRR